uniref:Thermolysin metallopeptidase n=1 Tax=Racemicystis crocea TaxID=1707966 RepID=A0A3S7V0M7_9BACT|nr:thermolysin metallopeptidase [Racemicystis crocea]
MKTRSCWGTRSWSRIGIAAVLAIATGACGAGSDPAEQNGDAPENDPESTATAQKVSTAVPSSPSRREHKREAEQKMAAKAAQQISTKALEALKPELRLGALDTLRPVNAHPFENGSGSVRAAHYHNGLRVIGSSLIIHTDEAGHTRSVTNALRPEIRISTSPTLDPQQAVEVAKADPERLPYREEPDVELAILPMEELVVKATGRPPEAGDRDLNAEQLERVVRSHRLVYVVDTDEEDTRAEHPTRQMRYLVDAHTGEIVRQRSRVNHSAANNLGLSMYKYPDSDTTFSNQVSLDTSWDSPWFDPSVYRYIMEDTVRSFYVQDNDSLWWYGANNLYSGDGFWGDGLAFAGDGSASTKNRQTAMVDAKWALQATWDMFDRVFQRQGPDDDFYDANCLVHEQTNWNDAEYRGLTGNIYVGDGSTRTSLDTLAHEYGHAFDDFEADLRECNNGEACGLSEANGDIVAVMTNYYVYNRGLLHGNSTIPDGTHSVNTGANSIDYWGLFNGRSFKDPKFPYYFSSIGSENEHDALGPMVAAFFFLARGASVDPNSNTFSYYLPWGMDGIGIHAASRIWYRAMTNYFTDTTTYANADDALIQAAKDLFGDTQPEKPEVAAVRNAMAAANFSSRASSYVMPPAYTESEPNDSQSQINWVPKPVDVNVPAGKPNRKEVFGNAGTNQEDWFQVWVPDGYALKVSLVPTLGNDHDLYVIEEGAAVGSWSTNAGSVTDTRSLPYVQNTSSGHKSYNILVSGYNSGTSGAYHLYIDWLPACSSAAGSEQAFGTTMAGCAGTVTWANRANLCGVGSHVCSAQEWLDRRGSTVPGHNYWTNDDLKFSGTGTNSCSASATTGNSCGANPMRVCSPTQADPEGNLCNWTGCGLDSTSNMYFGGCTNNTTAGTLCCLN